MFLIDEPYASPFLVETIKKNQYPILDTENARRLIPDKDLNWVAEQAALEWMQQQPHPALYSNSENALSWLEENLPEQPLTQSIRLFKDKFRFRAFLASIFPDFFFQSVALRDIPKLELEKLPFPFVIKPQVGFFSIGVHIIRDEADWLEAQQALRVEKLKSIFPPNVLNTSNFILEEYISGEEYAVDYYYNEAGEAVVLNIMHHQFASGTDTSDRVYTTSKTTIQQQVERIEAFLSIIGRKMEIKNFPAHAELRIDEKGQIVPIEINPMRFGGWCTTGDLLGISLGFNTHECFFKQEKPDWDLIFKGKEEQVFSLVVLDNNSGIPPSEIKHFDYTALAKDFEKPLLIREIDIQQYPVFGFVFAESRSEHLQELQRILVSDLRDYIVCG